jgi:hypothetical protein
MALAAFRKKWHLQFKPKFSKASAYDAVKPLDLK